MGKLRAWEGAFSWNGYALQGQGLHFHFDKKVVNLYNMESIRRLGIGNQLLIFTFLGKER